MQKLQVPFIFVSVFYPRPRTLPYQVRRRVRVHGFCTHFTTPKKKGRRLMRQPLFSRLQSKHIASQSDISRRGRRPRRPVMTHIDENTSSTAMRSPFPSRGRLKFCILHFEFCIFIYKHTPREGYCRNRGVFHRIL